MGGSGRDRLRGGDEPVPDGFAYHANAEYSQFGILIELVKGPDNDQGSFRLTHKGTGSAIEITPSGDITIHSEQNVYLSAAEDCNVVVDGDVNLETGGDLNADVGGDANIEAGGMVNVERVHDQPQFVKEEKSMNRKAKANEVVQKVLGDGRTLTSVAIDYDTNNSTIRYIVLAECKTRNPRQYAIGERDGLLGLKKPLPPSLAYLRRHKEAFLSAAIIESK